MEAKEPQLQRSRGGGAGRRDRAIESPSERLVRLGSFALTDAELVALIFSPHPTLRICRLADRLIAQGGGLKGLLSHEIEALFDQGGPKGGRAAQLVAALELARRAQQSFDSRPRLRSPVEVYRYLRPSYEGRTRESFRVLCFNSRNVLLKDVLVAQGSIDACPVDPRDVFSPALACRASGVVFAHNHPAGDPAPSGEDVQLTSRLIQGGLLLRVRVLDHLILGDRGFYSFLETGLLTQGLSRS